ncbi:MAG TPA: hypothetical protein VHK47_05295 [Polyangia bacterium]|jgi:hypothetical protein|nr:hypothetical protein [Polyangia bacterium]HVZ21951.1 hypothetical protein [Vicinamibacterales bacterium]
MNFRKTLITGSAAAAFGLLAGTAQAADTVPLCNDATMFPNPIVLSGSSAFEPTAALMAIKLSGLTGNDKVTLIYSASASCDGPKNILGSTVLTGSADYWTVNATDPTKADKHSCLMDGANMKADVGVSDIFYENCPDGSATVTGMVDTKGPVQAMLFVVPDTNTDSKNLTAAEAQLIWGCGMTGGVTPFTRDTTDTQQRDANSGTQGIVAKAINVPPAGFKGLKNSTGGALATAVTTSPNPGSAIGFLAADAYDSRRTQLNALAFQGFKQNKAYYADSTADSFDKRNVRDGHYVVWGPEHFWAAADNAGKITNQKAANFIGWVNGTATTAAFNYIDIEAAAGVIPQCAMKVTRDQDGPPVKLYTPAAPCGCYWESKATKTATPPGCTACTDDSGCTGGKKCSNNFCE